MLSVSFVLNLFITNQGYRDIERHLSSSLHLIIAREMVLQPRITDSFSYISESSAGKVTAAEVKFTASFWSIICL